MNPMLESFIMEARDLLEAAGRCFLELEKRPGDQTLLNDLFRSIHTLKGSSGLFPFLSSLTLMVHAAEDVLDVVREGGVELTSDRVDLFLDVMDQVGLWLDEVETKEALPPDAGEVADRFRSSLHGVLNDETGERQVVSMSRPIDTDAKGKAGGGGQEASGIPGWLADVPGDVLNGLGAGQAVVALRYRPEEGCFFTGDDPLLTVRQIPGLLWFTVRPRKPWPPLAEFDPFQCNLEFFLLAGSDPDLVEKHFQYVRDQVEMALLDPSQGVGLKGEKKNKEDSARSVTDVSGGHDSRDPDRMQALDLLRAQLEVLSLPCSPDIWEGRLRSCCTVAERIWRCLGADSHADRLSGKLVACIQGRTAEPVMGLIREYLEEQGEVRLDREPAEMQPGPETVSSPPPGLCQTRKVRRQGSVIKVHHSRIDALMDLSGELVVAKNALPFLARRAEEVFGVRELAREIKAQYAVINRIAEDLQAAVMQVSMVPVSTVFQRFPRLIRDLSRKLGKKIRLVMKGEETEADKDVVENLAEPMIHMVRNAIDHGIETPEERIRRGKDPEGELRISAIQENDQVVIEVADDGAGIDPDVIRQKAYEKGIISEDELEDMDDREALQLIFAAGLSTADSVSDLSGRGVGMDVVKNAVNRSGGTISVESAVGRGTTVRIGMPLTMAVTQVMMIEVSGSIFGVHIDAIVETVRVPGSDIRRIKNREVVVLRENLIPLCRLRQVLELDGPTPAGTRDTEAVLVVQVGGEQLGLVVDDFREGVDIILKPMEGIMAGLPLYAGTALLGDGRVLLVLDLKELVRCR